MATATEPLDYSSLTSAPQVATRLPAQKDKKVKSGRAKSARRGAQDMRDLQALGVIPTPAVRPDLSVIETPTLSLAPTSCLSPDLAAAIVRPSASPSAATPKKLGARAGRYPCWYEHGAMYGGPPVRSYRAPTLWRDASDIHKAEYCHRALQTLGHVYTLNLNLRHDIEAKARRQKDPCDWLRRRIAQRLGAGLGRSVDLMLAFEEDPDHWDEATGRFRPRLHVHGEFVITPNEAVRARAALRKAGGEWKDVRHHQAKIVPAPDAGWVGYIGKDFWKTTPSMREFMKHSRFFAVTFDGNVFSATRPVTQKARQLFEADRLRILQSICGKSI